SRRRGRAARPPHAHPADQRGGQGDRRPQRGEDRGARARPLLPVKSRRGRHADAVSVVADAIDVVLSNVTGATGLVTRSVAVAKRPLRSAGLSEVRWYLRFPVVDRPGVIAKLAAALGDAGVSIEQMMQGPPSGDPEASVDVVILTRTAREDAV